MKKRATTRHARTPLPAGNTAEQCVTPEEKHRTGDDAGLIVVPDQQFDVLLALLDDPPTVTDELRREIANRRWA